MSHWIQHTRAIFKDWFTVKKLKYCQYSSWYWSVSPRNVWWNFTLNILQKYFARAFSNKSFQVSKITEQNFKGKFAWILAKSIFHRFLNVSRFSKSYFWWKYNVIYGWKLLPVFGCSKKSDALNAQNSTKGLWTEKRRGPLNFRAGGRRGWPHSKTRA